MTSRLLLITGLLFFTNQLLSQSLFSPVKPNWEGKKVIIPANLDYDILFREGDIVVNNKGGKAPSKGDHDYNFFIPKPGSEDDGTFYVSHETNDTSTIFGDGGGGTIFKLKQTPSGEWLVNSEYHAIDFSSVGGTYNNCSGGYTTKGTILSAEEFPPIDNKELYRAGLGFRDTSDFNGMKRYQNMGWVVEVDHVKRKAINKLYKLGRYSHEGILAMPDSVTIYLTDDYAPSVFFKFVANKPNDYTDGQLYAYKQSDSLDSGSWITLPMDQQSLINIRDVALDKGATAFIRMEWITYVNDKIYITETGLDDFSFNKEKMKNGKLANHIEKYNTHSDKYDYPYGSVLEFDLIQNSMKVLLAGGQAEKDSTQHFSNPDGITYCKLKGKTYLVINEDIIGITKGRVDEKACKESKTINEIYLLDLSIKNPTVDDLERFLVAPVGAETTGGTFSPDFKTYFVNIQHPSPSNPAPFNRSMTIGISDLSRRYKK